MNQHQRGSTTFAVVLALLMAGCGAAGPCGDSPTFTAGDCPDGKRSMRVGQTLGLTIKGSGKAVGDLGGRDACPVQDATWLSSNPAVASVAVANTGGASTGSITALSPGTTAISAVVKWSGGTTGTAGAKFDLIALSTGSGQSACTITVTN